MYEQQDTPPVNKKLTKAPKSQIYMDGESARLLDTVYECPDDSVSSISAFANSFIGSPKALFA